MFDVLSAVQCLQVQLNFCPYFPHALCDRADVSTRDQPVVLFGVPGSTGGRHFLVSVNEITFGHVLCNRMTCMQELTL